MMTALWARPAFSPSVFPSQSFLSWTPLQWEPEITQPQFTTRTIYSPVQIIAAILVLIIAIKPDYISIKTKKKHQDKKIMASHMPRLKIAWTFVHDFKAGISMCGTFCIDQGPSTTNHIKLPLI